MIYTIYGPTGEFIAKASCSEAWEAAMNAEILQGAGYLVGDYDGDSLWYDISAGVVKQRQHLNVHLDGNRMTGVPAGAALFVRGEKHRADGTDIELTFDQPGQYEIKVVCPPFLPFQATINYEDPHQRRLSCST
jgi:hypothetical protein